MKSPIDSTTPHGNVSPEVLRELDPAPLLDAFQNFQGSFHDLDSGVSTSAAELKNLKDRFAGEIKKRGIAPGDRVLMAILNGPSFAAVWAAALESGASPILVHGNTPKAELDRIAETWSARLIVSEAGGTTGSDNFGVESDKLNWRIARARERASLKLVSVPLHPTSGTSGTAKLAARPGPCAVAEPRNYIKTLRLNSAETILCAIPMSHAYGYGMCFLVSLLTSARLVVARRFNPETVVRALKDFDIALFPAVPTMLDTLLALDATEALPSPGRLLSAGGPLQRNTFEAFRDRWGVPVRSLYGSTETGGISIAAEDAQFDGSVGSPMEEVEVGLRALQEEGEPRNALRVRSSSMMFGYLEGDSLQRDCFDQGWFETGDIGTIDPLGRIHLKDRLSEVINVLGMKVLPSEVEEVIGLLPQVREVKVYAGRWRGQPVLQAAVVCGGTLVEQEIIDHCERHLAPYKCPVAIKLCKSLPRNAAGKISIAELMNDFP